MNKLTTYLKALKASGVTQRQFAENAGVSQGFISMLSSGQRLPKPDVAKKIQEATNGEIPAMYWWEQQILGDDSSGSSQNKKHS